MKNRTRTPRLSRRSFIKLGALAAGASALPSVTTTSAQPRSVPRARTLTLVWSGSREGRWIDYELWNPYAIGSNHQNGPGIFYEPLAYYSAFADKEYLWLAESYKVQPRFQGADHQDALRRQMERRHALQRRRCDLHAEYSQGARAEGALGRGCAAVH